MSPDIAQLAARITDLRAAAGLSAPNQPDVQPLLLRLAAMEAQRRADLAAIHASAKRQGLDEDTRRAMIRRLSAERTASSGEMTAAERADLLRELGGGKYPLPPRPSRSRGEGRPMDGKTMLRRVDQLLAAANLPAAYAEAILRRQRGIADTAVACPLVAASDPELRGVIAALYRRAHPHAPRRSAS